MSYIFKELNSLILLTKPRVIFLIVFTAIIGMLLSSPNIPSLSLLIYSFIGIWMISSSAAVFNCIVPHQYMSYAYILFRIPDHNCLILSHDFRFSASTKELSVVHWPWSEIVRQKTNKNRETK